MNGPSSDMECLRNMDTLGTLFIPCSIPSRSSQLKGLKILSNQTSAQILNQQVISIVNIYVKNDNLVNVKEAWKLSMVKNVR